MTTTNQNALFSLLSIEDKFKWEVHKYAISGFADGNSGSGVSAMVNPERI